MRTYYHTPTGRIGIPAADLRHVRRHANGTFEDVSRQHPFWALTQPGVTFTPEQDAQIRAFVAANRLQEAQRIILDELARLRLTLRQLVQDVAREPERRRVE